VSYIALYRQWRPQRFSDVVGQAHISKTLKNAIKTNRISHAYLFSGPRGTGKTSSAKIMAKAVNCLAPKDGEACNTCVSCRLIAEGNSMDIIEIDAASNRGIDEIRDLREKVKFAPVEGRYKVYIIDEVHMLTTEAFNALLKTLEEPPQHVIFILATTEPHKIPLTVLSRCQRFDFKRIGYKDIVLRLNDIIKANHINADAKVIQGIAKRSEGSMRDALSLLDQCVSFSEGKVTEETLIEILGTVDSSFMKKIVQALAERDLITVLSSVEELINQGKDLRQFLNDLLEFLRNMLMVKLSQKTGNTSELPDYLLELALEQEQSVSEEQLFNLLQVLSEGESALKYSSQPRIALEISLIKAVGVGLTGLPLKEPDGLVLPKISGERKREETMVMDQERAGDDSGPNLETVKGLWKKVLDGVKKQRPTTYAYLIEGDPVEVRDKKIILRYRPNFQLHMQNLNLPVHKTLVERVLFTIFNQELFVQGCSQDEDKKHSLVDDARELFGENVIEIKE